MQACKLRKEIAKNRRSTGILVALITIIISLMALAEEPKKDTTEFGEPIVSKLKLSLSEALRNSEKYIGKTFTCAGNVEKVCEKKGCWMILKSGEDQVRVTFKDYGFFVPKSIHGKNVQLEGSLLSKTYSVRDQKHFLKDEGRPQNEIDAIEAPKQTLEFVASGVKILK